MAMLYLVRHGASVDQKLIRGRLPGYPLSKKGRKQAERAAEFLADKKITAVYSGPLERARQTAEIIARKKHLKAKVAKQLNEWNAPKWEGKYWSQVPQTDVIKYVFRPTTLDVGGETIKNIADRFSKFCRAVSAHSDAVCVSHRDVIVAGKLALLKKNLDRLNLQRCKPGSVTVLEKKNGEWKQTKYFEP